MARKEYEDRWWAPPRDGLFHVETEGDDADPSDDTGNG